MRRSLDGTVTEPPRPVVEIAKELRSKIGEVNRLITELRSADFSIQVVIDQHDISAMTGGKFPRLTVDVYQKVDE